MARARCTFDFTSNNNWGGCSVSRKLITMEKQKGPIFDSRLHPKYLTGTQEVLTAYC